MKTTVLEELACRIEAISNCRKAGNIEWEKKHAEVIRKLALDYLPSGSGFDSGTTVSVEACTPDRLVLSASYHHMDDGGSYDGWTEHEIIVTASLAHAFNIRVTGRDRNGIKDYIAEIFHSALSDEFPE